MVTQMLAQHCLRKQTLSHRIQKTETELSSRFLFPQNQTRKARLGSVRGSPNTASALGSALNSPACCCAARDRGWTRPIVNYCTSTQEETEEVKKQPKASASCIQAAGYQDSMKQLFGLLGPVRAQAQEARSMQNFGRQIS